MSKFKLENFFKLKLDKRLTKAKLMRWIPKMVSVEQHLALYYCEFDENITEYL
jgi:hypothetical protein